MLGLFSFLVNVLQVAAVIGAIIFAVWVVRGVGRRVVGRPGAWVPYTRPSGNQIEVGVKQTRFLMRPTFMVIERLSTSRSLEDELPHAQAKASVRAAALNARSEQNDY